MDQSIKASTNQVYSTQYKNELRKMDQILFFKNEGSNHQEGFHNMVKVEKDPDNSNTRSFKADKLQAPTAPCHSTENETVVENRMIRMHDGDVKTVLSDLWYRNDFYRNSNICQQKDAVKLLTGSLMLTNDSANSPTSYVYDNFPAQKEDNMDVQSVLRSVARECDLEGSPTTTSNLKCCTEIEHQRSNSYCCTLCSYRSSRISDLKGHTEAIHQDLKRFCCPCCQYKTSRGARIKAHIESVHQGIKRYCCPHCLFKTSERGNLKRHVEALHLGLKRHTCPHCFFQFGWSHNLKQHVETIHQGLKRYCCPHCDVKFSQSSGLKKHVEAIHLSYKKHCCPHCHVKFSDTSTLKRHIEAIHLGLKKYHCSHCLYKCTRSSSLKRHIQQHIKVKEQYCSQ